MRQLKPVILVTAAAEKLEDRALFAVDATDSDGTEGYLRWIDHPASGGECCGGQAESRIKGVHRQQVPE